MARPRRKTDGGRPLSDALERTLIAEYRSAWKLIRSELDQLNAQVRSAKAAGVAISRGWIVKQARLDLLEQRIFQQVSAIARLTEGAITRAQVQAIFEARREAERLIARELGPAPAGVFWTASPPLGALERLIGNTATGKPLGDLLAKLPADAAGRMRRKLATGLILGRHPSAVARDLRTILGGNLGRARTIARTELLRAYRESARLSYEANRDVVSGWVWEAEPDACEFCLAQEGIVFSVDEDMDTHPNAVLAGSTFVPYGQLLNMVAARYAGPAVRVLAGPEVLTIGPNHPVLTRRGMVAAHALREGDELVYDLRVDQAQTWNEPDLEDVPLAEDAFQTLSRGCGNVRVTAAGGDLHGDRVFCQGKVHVVEPHRELLPVLDSCGIEEFRDVGFVLPDVELAQVASVGALRLGLDAVDLASTSGMGGGGSWGAHYVFLPIEDVAVRHFEGWAFDASTDTSLYCSNGFLVSNCRCAMIPQTVGWDELAAAA